MAPRLLDTREMRPATPVPIAFVMTSCDAGGTERQMIELLRRLDRSRWEVHVACVHKRGAWLGRMTEAASSVAEFPIRGFLKPDLIRHAHAFGRWCRSHAIAVVHTTDFYTNIFALPPAALAGVPVRVANRRDVNPGRSLGRLALQRAAYQCAHRIVANTRAAADRLRLERVPSRKVSVVPNGIDSATFAVIAHRAQLRRVVIVANLRPEKGHDVLVDAAPAILERFPDAMFEIVGDGPERPALEWRVRGSGLTRAFTFHGHEEDVAARLGDADIFVLPSRSEALPNAVLEAMSAGLPVVASAVGGLPDLIAPMETGLLVPPGDPHALATAVCTLMADRDLGVRLGRAASDAVRGRYSFERMTQAFETLYLDELARRGAGSRRPAAAVAS